MSFYGTMISISVLSLIFDIIWDQELDSIESSFINSTIDSERTHIFKNNLTPTEVDNYRRVIYTSHGINREPQAVSQATTDAICHSSP